LNYLTSTFQQLSALSSNYQHFPATFQQLISTFQQLFSTYQHISLQKVGVKDQHVTSDLISFSFCFSIRILLGGMVSMDISLSALSS